MWDVNMDFDCKMSQRKNDRGRCKKCEKPAVQSADGGRCIYVGHKRDQRGKGSFYGTIVGGKYNGKGEYRFWDSGDRYIGEFRDDEIEGYG